MVDRLVDPVFRDDFDTDKLDLYEVVGSIIEQLNAQHRTLPGNKVLRFLRRLHVTISHIQLR